MRNEPLRAYDGDGAFVFASYAHKDAAEVSPLLRFLADEGINVWFDEGISPGNIWREELAEAIDRCGLLLYIVTPDSAGSRNCQRECGYALDANKQVLAVHLHPTSLPKGLALSLADEQAILAYQYSQADFNTRMIEAISRLLDVSLPATNGRSRTGSRFLLRRFSLRHVALTLTVAVALLVAGGWLRYFEFGLPVATVPVEVQRLTNLVGLEETPVLSPSGNTLAFVVADGDRRQVRVRLVAGGAHVAITDDAVDGYAPRWAPDSSSLIYYTTGNAPGEHGTIWEAPALGGSSRQLTRALAPGDLSHDGRYVAFFRAHEVGVELVVATRDEAAVRTVTRLRSGVYDNLRWSPNDESLVYTFDSGGAKFSTALLVVPVSGGEPRLVTDDYYLQGVDWLPEGDGFVVSSARGSLMSYPPTYNLWSMSVDGTDSTQLTFGEFSFEDPDVTADGRILVSRVHSRANIWRFPVDGNAIENVRAGEQITRQTGLLQTVSASPDESQVVFLSDAGGHANVWTARTVEGEMHPVTRETNPAVIVAVPEWSPRGDWIAFLSNRNSSNATVSMWLARPDGSEMHDLGVTGAWTCWSEDGRWLYYTDLTDGNRSIRKLSIDDDDEPVTVRTDNAVGCSVHGGSLYYARVMASSYGMFDLELRHAEPESDESRVIGHVAGIRVPSAAYDFQATISPDGTRLAMPLRDGSTSNLWTLDPATSEWRQVTDFKMRNVIIARRIAWSRDGASLYAAVSEIDSDIVLLTGMFTPERSRLFP